MGASVKIMLSYDYCHFEICKSTDAAVTDQEIDAMRKDVQRLADKAVRQYIIAKEENRKRLNAVAERESAERDVARIELKPAGERTVNEVALVKAFKDKNWSEYISRRYDYEDDFEPESSNDD